MADHEHSAHGDTDACFGCKMRYIRDTGGLALATPRMAPGVSFYDTTIKEQQDQHKAMAKAEGWESRQKTHYDW